MQGGPKKQVRQDGILRRIGNPPGSVFGSTVLEKVVAPRKDPGRTTREMCSCERIDTFVGQVPDCRKPAVPHSDRYHANPNWDMMSVL